MAYHDFREYLESLDKAGEYRRSSVPVDAKWEAGAIVQRIAEGGGPCVHFSAVKEAADGWTLVGASMNRGIRGTWSKVAGALEIDTGANYHGLLDDVMRRMEAGVKPMQVRSGPCKENIIGGSDVSLDKLLVPWVHGDDAAPCVSSWGFTVVQEPGSKYSVWNVTPHLVLGRRELVAPIRSGTPLAGIFERYRAAGEAMPFAIVLGGSPVALLAAAFNRRRGGATAAEIAGALQRAPMQLVKCETSDLLVPATAEVVIEGVVRPGRTAPIGTFPGTFGYLTSGGGEAPIWEVTAMTHRHRPVVPFATWGVPVTEIHLARSLDCDVQLKQEFIKRGTPVTGVYTPPWLAGSTVAVATKIPFTAFSQSIAGIVRTTEATKAVPYVMVFDEDIDVTNATSIFHAMGTKCRPGRDTWKIHNTCGAHDAPFLDETSRQLGQGVAFIVDCTWPLDWDRSIAVPPRVSFDQCYPVDLQERIRAGWTSEYGFPPEESRPVRAL